MSYQVLARKWRPKKFEEVVGQDHVVKALSNSLSLEKIHHAYLLTGTRGVGKTTIARILTKSLNCEKGLTASPCDNCSSCLAISDGHAMDFYEVDAASRRGVEETQQLLETVAHMPSSSRYKVYLIDEVHMLTNHSFNALLKTLEEPPPHVIFILATTEPENIPATVLSRCLQFNLKNLPPKILFEQLEYILQEEKIEYDSGSITQIARSGRGSLRDCLTLLDQGIVFCNGSLTSKQISEMLGTLAYEEVYSLLSNIIDRDSDALLNKLREISESSLDYQRLLDLVLEAIQSLTIAQIEPKALMDVPVDKSEIVSLSNLISPEDAQVLYQTGLIAKRDLDLAPDQTSGFEMAMIRMMLFLPNKVSTSEDEELSIKKQPTKMKILKDKKSDEEVKSHLNLKDQNDELIEDKVRKTELEDDQTTFKKTDIKKFFIDKASWNDIFLSLDLTPGTRQLISHCSFSHIDELVVYFSLPEDKLKLLGGKHRKEFQESLCIKFNKELDIFYEPSAHNEDSPNVIKEKISQQKQQDLENSIRDDPNVQLILNDFEANIIDSSIKEKNEPS